MKSIAEVLSRLLILPIRFYQRCISPLTPPSCRFTPTCSQYAIEALQKHGPVLAPNRVFYLGTRSFENSEIEINKAPGSLVEMPANSNLNDLIRALNSIGVAPVDLISILQALKKSGSLQAELIII